MLSQYGLDAIVCEMGLAELRRSGRRGLDEGLRPPLGTLQGVEVKKDERE